MPLSLSPEDAKLALHMTGLIDKASFVLHEEALFRLVRSFLNNDELRAGKFYDV
jgi:hypothetical protein